MVQRSPFSTERREDVELLTKDNARSLLNTPSP